MAPQVAGLSAVFWAAESVENKGRRAHPGTRHLGGWILGGQWGVGGADCCRLSYRLLVVQSTLLIAGLLL